MAVTVPDRAGRVVPDWPGAVALSEAYDDLREAVWREWSRQISPYCRPADPRLPSIVLSHSDTPGGPETIIEFEEVAAEAARIGRDGVDAATVAALGRVMSATAMPVARHNEMNAANPGGPHRRYRPGDTISADTLDLLESAVRLLRLPCPANREPEDPSQGWLTVTEASDFLVRELAHFGFKLTPEAAKTRVTRATDDGVLESNGRARQARRIDRGSCVAWCVDQRQKALDDASSPP